MSIRMVAAFSFFVFFSAFARGSAGSRSPHIPFSFVENRGQADTAVRYIGVGPGFKAWFSDRGLVIRHGQTTVKIVFEGRSADVSATAQRVSNQNIKISADNRT